MAKVFGEDPGSWAALADFAPDLSYADWRDEVLSLLDAGGPAPRRPPAAQSESVVTRLRPAV
jgi:hypothetical protein